MNDTSGPRPGRGRRRVHGTVPEPGPPPIPTTPGPIQGPPPRRPTFEAPPPPPPDPSRWTSVESEEFRAAIEEAARREKEALRLFEPMPEQERFFASDADERLAIGGNRGGKSTATLVEIARAVTGQDPHDKYPKVDGIFILVAIDLAKCSKVFYRKLFLPGAFKIIRDSDTGRWRAYRPDQDGDREDEARPAPPLIPARFVKEVSWENKKDRIPKTIRLRNGWEMWFYSSGGEWPQGVDVDGVAFDEELERDGWYGEMSARLADRRTRNRRTGKVRSGKFMWGATPQAGTAQLFELYSRAIEEQESRAAALARGEEVSPPSIEVFSFGILENPFIAQHAKDALVAKYRDKEEEYAVRIEGKFALIGSRVYPEFAPKGVHGSVAFSIPEDWTRYAFVDPGRQVCAVLFVAIAPPRHPLAGRRIIYDELYIQRCNAQIFADQMRRKLTNQVIEAWWIDHRAGRETEIGSGLTIEQQYTLALKEAGVKCERSGHQFGWASDDVKGGITAVQSGLHVRDGHALWLVLWEKVPKFVWEAARYSYRRLPSGFVTDEPVKLHDHLMDCWRYAALANLPYVSPRHKAKAGYTNEYLKQKRQRESARAKRDRGIRLD